MLNGGLIMKKSIIWIAITFCLLLVVSVILYSLSITGILETKEYEINDKYNIEFFETNKIYAYVLHIKRKKD